MRVRVVQSQTKKSFFLISSDAVWHRKKQGVSLQMLLKDQIEQREGASMCYSRDFITHQSVRIRTLEKCQCSLSSRSGAPSPVSQNWSTANKRLFGFKPHIKRDIMQFFVQGACLIRTLRIGKAISYDVSKMTVILSLKDITLQDTSYLIPEVRNQSRGK